MKKKLFIVTLLIITVGATTGYVLYNKPAQKKITASAEEQLKATELFSAYEKDENKANQRFLNKVIEVTGTVSNISPSGNSGMTIQLSTGNEMSSVSCEFADTSGIHKISEGTRVKVKGKCTGILMDVVLVQCSLEEQ